MWNEYVATVQMVLVQLFPLREDAVMIVQEAGIRYDRINFDEPAYTRWFNILDESLKQGNVDKLLTVASSRYPYNKRLSDAVAAWSVSREGAAIEVELSPLEVFRRAAARDMAELNKRLSRVEDMLELLKVVGK